MSDLTSGGKALVRAGRDADRPSAADRERVLAALRARLGDAAVLATGVAHLPPKTSGVSAVRSKLVKWGWVGPTAALVAGAWWFVPRAGHEGGKAVPAPSASMASVTKVAAPIASAAPE